MADSLSQKSSKSGDKSKHCLTLNRTTSETLRISEPEKNINHPSSLSSTSGANIRKKAPSFQITSVTVGSRISNDGGDDSADDLDESHTEDMSDVVDRITDLENETPSYSEDTFSREDLFYSSALTTAAPVIPTSSQYGLAIVSEGSGGTSLNNVGANIVGDFVSVADNVMLNLSVKHAEERDPHHPHVRNERFKVVKIESTEPFKRGRWTCMDYLDHTMVQPVSGHEEIVGAPGEAYHEGVVLPMSSAVFHPHAQSQIFTVHPLQQGVGNTVAGQSLPAGIVPHAAQPAPQYYSPPSHPSTILPTDNGPTSSQVQHQPGSGGSVSTQTQTGHNASVSPPSSNGPGAHNMIQSPIMNNNMQNTAPSQPMLQQQSQPGLRSVGSSGNLQQHAASSINQAPSSQQQQHASQMQHQSVMQQQSNANMQQMQQMQQQQQQYIQQQQPQQQQYIQAQKPATTQLPPGFIHQNMNSVPQQGSNYSPQQQQQQPQQAMSQPAGFVSANMMQQTMSVNQPQQQQQQMPGASQAQSYVQQPQQPVYSQTQAMSQPAGFISQTVQQPQQQVMSNFVSSSNQQLPPQQTVNYMPVTNPVQQQQQLPSSVPQPVSQPSLVNHTPAVMPNTVHVTAGQNYMQTQSSIPSMPQQHQLPVQTQNTMPSMPQQPVQTQNSMPPMSQQPVQNSMPHQHQQTGQSQSSIPSMQHQQPVQIQNSMPQQHQQPVQPPNSMPSMPQQHQQLLQTQNSMPQQQQQQSVQTQNSMPQQHQQLLQSQTSMPQQQSVQTQNSMPQQHQQLLQTQNSMPQQQQQQSVQTQNSMPQQHQQSVQTQNSMPQQHQQSVQTQNSMPQQHQQPVQTQSSMPQQHPVQMVNHQPGQSYSHHPVAPLVSNSSSQTVTAQSYSHPLNVNVPQPVPARTAPAPLVITNGSPMSTPHMEPASRRELLNVGVLEPHLLESLADVATSMGTTGSEDQPAAGEDAESSSGTSAVAIDNKIEQAMDLVKSHLMFAVREEVEVLKEKIVELTGRINQLEYENTVLKAHATQETLQQLVVPLPQQLPQQPVPPQQQAPAPQAAPAPATMMGGGGGKAQQAPTSVS